MERLTTRVEDKVYYSKGEYPPTTLCAEMETWEVRECMKKLAEYEDLGLSPEEIKEQIEILKHNNKCMKDTLERQYDNARKLLDEQEKDCDYWKREALKWANEIGEQRIGPLIWMDEERGK